MKKEKKNQEHIPPAILRPYILLSKTDSVFSSSKQLLQTKKKRKKREREGERGQWKIYMVACCLRCQLAIVVDMNRCTSSPSHLCAFKPCQFSGTSTSLFGFGFGFGFEFQRKERFKRRLKFVLSAELSKPFALSFGLDSQVTPTYSSLYSLSFIFSSVIWNGGVCWITDLVTERLDDDHLFFGSRLRLR